MTEAGSSTVALARRVMSYARPYAGRMTIGIVAGLVSGGSLFGLLQFSPNVIIPFEERVATPPPLEQASSPAASEAPPPPSVDEDPNVARLIAMADRFGVPARQADGRMTWQLMLVGMLGLFVCVTLRSVANYVNRYYMRWIGARIVRDLRNDLFGSLQNQSLKFFGKSDVGQLISRCTHDTQVVEQVLTTTIADITRAPLEILVAAVFIVTFSVSNDVFGLVALMSLAFPLCFLPIIVLGRVVRQFTRRALTGMSTLVSRMHENFTGITVVKAFHMERREHERFRSMNAGYFRSMMRALRAELLMSPLMEAVAVIVVGVFFMLCYRHGIKLHQIIPLGLAGLVAYKPTKQLARINAWVQRGSAALDRVFEILDRRDIVPEAANPVRVSTFADRIVFDHVSFSYEEPSDAPVLSDICMDVPVGSVVALVGETGSGKTTLANLLARFYDPTGGRILLDGTDLREIEIASLRRLIGVVGQHTVLFNDTIAANISYGMDHTTASDIEDAARQANADRFIVGHPDGYDRRVGEKGFVLSGGERQRIAIARAILKNPPILILDEATSALDTVTERLIQDAISRVMEGRTVFAIAHRLSTVKHADQILLLDDGCIVERGTHDALYNAGGRYRALCDMQVMDA